MAEPARHRRPGRGLTTGLLGYVAAWSAAGALAAATALVLSHEDQAAPNALSPVALPPVREARMADAVRSAGCRVAALDRSKGSVATVPRPGIVSLPLSAAARRAAARHGLVVIEYRRDVGHPLLDQLAVVQRAVPNGTVLAPSARLRSDRLSVTTYGRQLRCRAMGRPTLDAIRLFRGRYLGVAPASAGG
jgi:hypothetical protein